MSVLTLPGRRRPTRYGTLSRAIVTGTIATLAACSQGDAPSSPRLAPEPEGNPQLKKAAFIADVNMRTGKVVISAPVGGPINGPSLSVSGGGDGPRMSILAGDAVTLVVDNYRASAVGAFVPGKVRVSFDVGILNKLQGYALVTPTFPAAPSTNIGALLFPFSTNVTTTSGGAGVGGDGTEVIIDLPSYGEVVASEEWNGDGSAGSGAPYNFFNDNLCSSGDNDCYRWEAFGAPVVVPGTAASVSNLTSSGTTATATTAADHGLLTGDIVVISGASPAGYNGTYAVTATGATTFTYTLGSSLTSPATGTITFSETTKGIASLATSALRGVSFDVDPTVGQFRARLIVAADLLAATPPVGDLSGTVSSPQRGNLAGVQVSVSGNSTPATTAASGVYSFTGLPIGPKTVSIVAASLPSGCTAPASQNTSIVGSSSVTVNFSVTCTVPQGTVQGTVSSSLGGGIQGVTAVVTPTGLSSLAGVVTDASGLYTRNGVPVGSAGTGEVALQNVPSNCTNAGPYPYSGLTDGGTVTLNITLSCTAPPEGYNFGYSIVSTSGSQVTVEMRIDMGSYDDPAISGADNIGSIDAVVSYNTAELSFVSTAASPGGLDATANGTVAGQVSVTAQSAAGATGLVGIVRITFNRIGSGPDAVLTTNISEAITAAGYNLLPKILISNGSIPRP